MVILRRTQKLAAQLPASAELGVPSDTALGDWYVNRLIVDRKPLLLIVSSRSLVSLVVPSRDVRTLPSRLPALVARRLKRMRIPDPVIAKEVAAMSPVRIAKTVDRSVVGILVDFASMIPYYLDQDAWDETTLPFIEAKLAKNPCFAGRPGNQTVFPEDATPALLASRWAAD
jgi:hypothetical protein